MMTMGLIYQAGKEQISHILLLRVYESTRNHIICMNIMFGLYCGI